MAAPAPTQEQLEEDQQQNSVSDLNSTHWLALDQLHQDDLNEQEEEERMKQEGAKRDEEEQGQERIDKLALGRRILQEAAKRCAKGSTPEEKDSIALEYIETTLDKCALDKCTQAGTFDQIALDAHIEGVLRSRNLLAILLEGRKAVPSPPLSSNIPHLMQQKSPVKQFSPRPLHSSPTLRSALLRSIPTLPRYHSYNSLEGDIIGSSRYKPTIYDSFLKCIRSWQPKPIDAVGDQFLTDLLTVLLKMEKFTPSSFFFPLSQLAELIFIDKANRARYMRYYTLVMTLGISTHALRYQKEHRRRMMSWNQVSLLNCPGTNKYKFNIIHILFKSFQIDALIDWLLLIPSNRMRNMILDQFTTFTIDHQKTLKLDAEYTAAKTTTMVGGYKITMVQRLCAYVVLALFKRLAHYTPCGKVPNIKLTIDADYHVTLPDLKHPDSLHDFLRKMREYVQKNQTTLEFTPYEAISPEADALVALSDAASSSFCSSSSSSSTSSTSPSFN